MLEALGAQFSWSVLVGSGGVFVTQDGGDDVGVGRQAAQDNAEPNDANGGGEGEAPDKAVGLWRVAGSKGQQSAEIIHDELKEDFLAKEITPYGMRGIKAKVVLEEKERSFDTPAKVIKLFEIGQRAAIPGEIGDEEFVIARVKLKANKAKREMEDRGFIVRIDEIEATVRVELAAQLRREIPKRLVASGKADVRSEEDIRNLIEVTVKKYGKLHVMVNNAGVTPPLKPLHEYDLAEFNRVNESNYTATFLGIKYAVQAMLDTDSRECAVINIASASGLKATECFTPYDGSKHAVVGLTKSCALDYAKHDITVNAICPGVIDTEIFANAPQEVREINMKAVPMGRFGRPEEISYMALFLATDMARFITGAALAVDGGYTGGDQNNMPWGMPDPRNLKG